jgi:hypothetical protein
VTGGRGHQPDPGVAMLVLYQSKKLRQNARACPIESKRVGDSGRCYLTVVSRGVVWSSPNCGRYLNDVGGTCRGNG